MKYPQGPEHTSILIYFYYEEYQNIQITTFA